MLKYLVMIIAHSLILFWKSQKKNLLQLGEVWTYGINGKFWSSEKKFCINSTNQIQIFV